ncbi:MAG TPA: UbiA-like polyprenyltransferase [Longimicrobiales bacterium]|nr:UbiA-like polyprenyltransferase [Longimicrobiales bacterium]
MSSRTEGQVFSGESLAARYASFVKLPHTLFALPFAGVGALLASYEHVDRLRVGTVLWIVIAFTAARFAAMGFNRIVDRRWDALNPRTAGRELPSGRLTLNQARAAVVVASAVFVAAAWLLNPLCGMLSPIALGWIFFYSYGKRFTAGAHHILGLALGIAPVGAFLAVAGTWPEPWYGLPLLAATVMFWVAGFDVIYAVQDLDFDRTHGLHSIPARLGARGAFGLARLFHAIAAAIFLAIGIFQLFPVGRLYLVGVAVVVMLLLHEHRAVRGAESGRLDLATVDRAFFHTNVAVSMSLFAFTLADRLALVAAG